MKQLNLDQYHDFAADSLRQWIDTESEDLLAFVKDSTSAADQWNLLEDYCNCEFNITKDLPVRFETCSKQLGAIQQEIDVAQDQVSDLVWSTCVIQYQKLLNQFDNDQQQLFGELFDDSLPFGELVVTQEYAFLVIDMVNKEQQEKPMLERFNKLLQELLDGSKVIDEVKQGILQQPTFGSPDSAQSHDDFLDSYKSPALEESDITQSQDNQLCRSNTPESLIDEVRSIYNSESEYESEASVDAPRLALVRAKRPHMISTKTSDTLFSEDLKFNVGDYLYVVEWGNDENMMSGSRSFKSSSSSTWWYCEDENGNVGRVINPHVCFVVEKYLADDQGMNFGSEIINGPKKKNILSANLKPRDSLIKTVEQSYNSAQQSPQLITPKKKKRSRFAGKQRKIKSPDFIHGLESNSLQDVPQQTLPSNEKQVKFHQNENSDPKLDWHHKMFEVKADQIPKLVSICIDYLLMDKRLRCPNLFSSPGNNEQLRIINSHFEKCGEISFKDLQSPEDAAALLKLWCAKTRFSPLKTDLLKNLRALNQSKLSDSDMCVETKKLLQIYKGKNGPHFYTLKMIIGFFVHLLAYQQIHIKEGSKRLDKKTLVRIFASSLFCNEYQMKKIQDEGSLISVVMASQTMDLWISNYDQIFN